MFYKYFNISPELENELTNTQNGIGSKAVNQLENVPNQISQEAVDQFETSENRHNSKSQQVVDQIPINILISQIPWGHIIVIISKIKDNKEAVFYIQKTKENNWSRDTLGLQIKSNQFKRNGTAITNFSITLPEPFSDLAQQTLKNPYIFDFLQLSEDYKEIDIENQLVNHLKKFLLELGKGFAFVRQQYHLEIVTKDYYIDLLFYHIKLKCYVVIELKNTAFIPECAGKLIFLPIGSRYLT